MEKIVRQSLLYDFYGELLTEHQKRIYGDIVNNDLSYSEIARINNISRQGVYDIIKRCDKILEEYEDKLQLISKFLNARKQVEGLQACICDIKRENKDAELVGIIDKIENFSQSILEEF